MPYENVLTKLSIFECVELRKHLVHRLCIVVKGLFSLLIAFFSVNFVVCLARSRMANPSTDVAAFKELVVQMVSSTDNEIRSAAEKSYNDILLQTRAHFLLQIYMDGTANTEVRFLMALSMFIYTLRPDQLHFFYSVVFLLPTTMSSGMLLDKKQKRPFSSVSLNLLPTKRLQLCESV